MLSRRTINILLAIGYVFIAAVILGLIRTHLEMPK